MIDGTQVRRKIEERTGQGLGQTEALEELILGHPVRHDLRLEHGKDDLTTSKDERSNSVHHLEYFQVDIVDTGPVDEKDGQGKDGGPKEEDETTDPKGDANAFHGEVGFGIPTLAGRLVCSVGLFSLRIEEGDQPTKDQQAGVDVLRHGGGDANVAIDEDGHERRDETQDDAHLIELLPESSECLEDQTDGSGGQTHQVPRGIVGIDEGGDEDTARDEHDQARQIPQEEGRQTTNRTGTGEGGGYHELRRGGAGQTLADGKQLRELLLVEPTPLHHQMIAKDGDVCLRATECDEAQGQIRPEHLLEAGEPGNVLLKELLGSFGLFGISITRVISSGSSSLVGTMLSSSTNLSDVSV